MLFLFQITIGQALLSFIAWGPFAVLCLQFLFRDPNLTSATSSAFPPLFAKAVTAIMPLLYKSNTSMAESTTPNGVTRAKNVQNDKTKWRTFVNWPVWLCLIQKSWCVMYKQIQRRQILITLLCETSLKKTVNSILLDFYELFCGSCKTQILQSKFLV